MGSLSARKLRRAWSKSLSMFSLGTCGGLCLGLLTIPVTSLCHDKGIEAVNATVAELSTKLRALRDAHGKDSTPEELAMPAVRNAAIVPTAIESEQEMEMLPKVLGDVADCSVEMFTKHLQDDVNAYGLPWGTTKNINGLEIGRSKIPGQSRYVWKVKFTSSSNGN